MTNLTVGQRIDVYEVVAGDEVHDLEVGQHAALSQYGGFLLLSNGGKDNLGFLLTYNEVRPCKYYLRVKSLKGAHNHD